MRPPARRAALSAAAVSAPTLPEFRLHLVRGRVFRFDGKEGTRPDVERYLVQADAARLQCLNDRVGEMQPRSRRSDRSLLAREHRLVVAAVLFVGRTAAGDIGWQRHVAAFGKRLVEHRSVKGEGERDLAALPFRLDRGVELVEETHPALAGEAHDIADGEALSGFTSAFQREPSRRRVNVAAIAGSCAPRPMRRPCRLAGMTFVSLTTTASPSRSSAGKSRMTRSSNGVAAPGRTTRSRALPRGAAGRSAMRSSGSGKSKRSVRISDNATHDPLAPAKAETQLLRLRNTRFPLTRE